MREHCYRTLFTRMPFSKELTANEKWREWLSIVVIAVGTTTVSLTRSKSIAMSVLCLMVTALMLNAFYDELFTKTVARPSLVRIFLFALHLATLLVAVWIFAVIQTKNADGLLLVAFLCVVVGETLVASVVLKLLQSKSVDPE